MTAVADLDLDAETRAALERYGFDRQLFDRLRARLRAGTEDNVISGCIEPPTDDELFRLPAPGTPEHAALGAAGERAIAAGQVGVVILAGGMATRFGGGVKAAAVVLPGWSFLALKLADVARAAERASGRVPVFLLVSFATHEVVEALGRQASRAHLPVETVAQFVSLRLDARGEIFRDPDGRASLYAPGHGDLTFALRASGALDRFRSAGGRLLFVSNVDNLAATLDAAVIGAHLARGKAVTVEVVADEPTGGAPVRVDGTLQVVEAFRFPRDYPQHQLPVFSTNTLLLDAAAIDRELDLTFFRVRKQVQGREVVQFERLLGQVTAFLPTGLLVVPRHPPHSRFEPIKDPADLDQRRPAIQATLAARGVL